MPNTPQTVPEEELKPYFKQPFRYDPEGQYIFDAENNMIADIRAWGHLKDERLQDALGELIAKAVSDAWNTRPLLPESGGGKVWLVTSGSGSDGDEWQVSSIHASKESAERAKKEYERPRKRSDGSTYNFDANEIEEWDVVGLPEGGEGEGKT